MTANATRTVSNRLGRLPRSLVVLLGVLAGNTLIVFGVSLLESNIAGAATTVADTGIIIGAASLVTALVTVAVLSAHARLQEAP